MRISVPNGRTTWRGDWTRVVDTPKARLRRDRKRLGVSYRQQRKRLKAKRRAELHRAGWL